MMSDGEELIDIRDVVRYLISRVDTIGTELRHPFIRYAAWAKAGPGKTCINITHPHLLHCFQMC